MPEKAALSETHLVRIRYAPKAQDTWLIFPEIVAFKDTLTVEKGYPSSLGSSFVIELQTHARRIGWNEFAKTRRKLGRFTSVVAYTSVTLKPWLHHLSTEPGVSMKIQLFTLSWSFVCILIKTENFLFSETLRRELLSVCQAYAEWHENIFNCRKQNCLYDV